MGSESGTKLDVPSLGNAVYLPHFYDKQVLLTRVYNGQTSEMPRVMDVYENDAERMGVPWMLGEYGIYPDIEGAKAYLNDQERTLSARLAGGTAWHWNPTDLDWNHEKLSVVEGDRDTVLMDALDRPYPKAIAGALKAYDFDLDAQTFTVEFDATDGETVIYVPARHFPGGPQVELTGGQYDVAGDHIVIRATGAVACTLTQR